MDLYDCTTLDAACAVIEHAVKEGLAPKIAKHIKVNGLSNFVTSKMYFPDYVPLVTDISKAL